MKRAISEENSSKDSRSLYESLYKIIALVPDNHTRIAPLSVSNKKNRAGASMGLGKVTREVEKVRDEVGRVKGDLRAELSTCTERRSSPNLSTPSQKIKKYSSWLPLAAPRYAATGRPRALA